MHYTGKNCAFIGAKRTFDPRRGFSYQLQYKGTWYGLTNAFSHTDPALGTFTYTTGGIIAAWVAAGYKYEVEKDGPYYKISTAIPVEGIAGQNTPIHKYKYKTDFGQEDLINAPKLQAHLAGLGEGGIATLYAKINNALGLDVEKGDDALRELKLFSEYAAYASIINYIVWMKRKGVQAFETIHPVLSREVQMTWDVWNEWDLDLGVWISPTNLLYSTAELGTVFGVLEGTLDRIFDAPPSQPGFTWAWKLRLNETDENEVENLVVINQEWVYAAWITNLYDTTPA